MALRAIGKRNPALNAAAVAVARRLADSPEAAARWVGKDALRELTSPAVTRRLAAKRRPPRDVKRFCFVFSCPICQLRQAMTSGSRLLLLSLLTFSADHQLGRPLHVFTRHRDLRRHRRAAGHTRQGRGRDNWVACR